MKIRSTNDYVNDLCNLFPEVSPKDIKRIINYCWKMIYLYNNAGQDTKVWSDDLIFFIGTLRKDSLDNYLYYIKKLARRIRFMFQRTLAEWDGYYYFALNDTEYKKYLLQTGKYKVFKNIRIYKLLEECKISEYSSTYIFRLSGEVTTRYIKWYSELRTKCSELIIQRDPLNMNDLMISNNTYKYIQ